MINITSNSKTLIKIHEFLINSFTSTALKQFKIVPWKMNTRIYVHTYIYTYVFIKKKKKTIFFCISNLTTKRRIEISPSAIQLRTAWFNLKQIYVRTWKGSTFEGNERRRLTISKERKISYKFEKILFRMKKKKKKESNTFSSRNLGGIFSRWCSFVETRRKVEENEAREQISGGT